MNKDNKISIIGIGYVGLPLAVEFGKIYSTIGYDTNSYKIDELKKFNDINNEYNSKEINRAKKLFFTSDINKLINSNIFIFTLPTPIFKNKLPDLRIIKSVIKQVGKFLKKNDLVIFESTVYPGATEEIFIPLLEKISKLKINKDFFCGYSPERINPGDKRKTITKIVKLTSGSNKKALQKVDLLYKSIIKAGTYKVESIKIAEAAKVIENTQRDLNIALVNEFSIIFNKLNLKTKAVLNAANTKWNFLDFKPGLVGGHCVGVDPYYLTYQSLRNGYNPKVILSGRAINDGLGNFILKEIFEKMKKKKIKLFNSNILFMGLSFKENCSDLRNSKIFQIIDKFKSHNSNLYLFDPYVKKISLEKKYQKYFIKNTKKNFYDVVIISIAHKKFSVLKFKDIKNLCKRINVIVDLKSIFSGSKVDFQL